MTQQRPPNVGGPLGTTPSLFLMPGGHDENGQLKRRIVELEAELDTVKRLCAENHQQHEAHMKGVYARLDNIERQASKDKQGSGSCFSWCK